ncbi:MAG: peptidoglycan-binding protein [Acidimicrobiales bacterium]
MTTIDDTHLAPPVVHREPEKREPRRRRRRFVRLVGGVTLVAVCAGAWLWVRDPSTEAASPVAGPVATATVERGTISATEAWDGTVDFGARFTIDSSAEGTVTRLVEPATAAARGAELYRLDERPVTLLAGAVPMYRDLGPGATGLDVAQLEANLAALGYAGFSADDTFADSTSDVVRAWQADIGVEPTGTVAHGDVVFVPEAGRVDAVRVDVGDRIGPGRPILDLTGTDKVVSVEADLDDRDRFGTGTEVTVVLPDGETVAGMVSTSVVVEVAAESADGPGGGNQAATEAVTAVEITLAGVVGDDLVGAPVDVVLAIEERTDVLLVPVNALLALSEGGYGLEVVHDHGTTRIVRVDTGLFADGKVQVEGDGIAEGTVVGVAGR